MVISVNVLPLWIPNLYPTISGAISESRDQVFTTVPSPGFTREIFFRIFGSTNGPFLDDLDMELFLAPRNDEAIRPLAPISGFVTSRHFSPFGFRFSRSPLSSPLSAAIRMINGIHDRTAHGG